MVKKGGNYITHVGAIRIRVSGSGNLRMRVISFGNVRTQVLTNTTMVDPTNILPTRLANFKDQKIQVEIWTTVENEVMQFDSIIPFVKVVASSYPQQNS